MAAFLKLSNPLQTKNLPITSSTKPSTTTTTMSPTPRSYFSTTHLMRNTTPNTTPNTNPNTNPTNPSYPRFSLKSISPNPRVRMALGAGLAVLAMAEGYAWIKFWPQISEKWRGGAGEGEA